MIVFKTKVVVDSPRCDKLSVTLAISPLEQPAVLEAIDALVHADYAAKGYTKAYSHCATIFLGNVGDRTLFVQAGPKKPGVSFFRLEFNPSKCDIAEVRSFIDGIVPSGGYGRLLKHGVCTRVDVAIDVHNIAPDGLLVTHAGLRATRTYQKGGIGQTYEFGSPQSAKYFCIYDKRVQVKAANSKAIFKQPVPDHAMTRIEARITERQPMNGLSSLPNPFAQLIVADFSRIKPTDEMTRLFLATSRAYGAKTALLMLSASREAFSKRLHAAATTWWIPGDLWKAWKKEANALLEPPPPSFNLSLLKPNAMQQSVGAAAAVLQ